MLPWGMFADNVVQIVCRFCVLGMLLVEMFSNLCVGTIYEQFTEGVFGIFVCHSLSVCSNIVCTVCG